MKVDTKKLRAKIEELILDQVGESIPGEDKLRAVIAAAADWLAKQTKLPIPDAVEAGIYRTILWLPVQFVYDHLKDLGKV